MRQTAIAILMLGLSAVTFQPVSAGECLKLLSPDNELGIIKLVAPVVEETFKTATICIDRVRLPSKRAQARMIKGEADGEMVRVMPYIKALKDHVVHVPTPVLSSQGYIVSRASSNFHPKGVKDIGDKTMGFLYGVKWHEAISKQVKNSKVSKKLPHLAKQLMAKRIDGFLVDKFSLEKLYTNGVLSKSDIYLSPAVLDMSGYIVLHKKNANLVEKLDSALKKVLKK